MTPRDQRLLAWRLVLLPVLLMAVAIWQGHRADAHRTLLLEDQGLLHGFIAQMVQMEANNDTRRVEFNGQTYEPYVAHSLAYNRLDYVEHELGFARIGTWLAHFSLPLSALLVLLGGASLAALRWAGKVALTSRSRLVELFLIARQVLPVILVALILLLTLTAVLEIAYEALWLFALRQTSTGVIKLQMLVGFLMLAMLWPLYRLPGQLKAMLQLFKTEPLEIYGNTLAEHQAPALWARVRALAQRVDALVPDHIVVGFLDGFYVTSSDVLLYPDEQRLQGRTLYLPLPLLAMLGRTESDAVIAHELAHFSGEDTDYSMRFVPIYHGVWRSISVLDEHMQGGFLRGMLTLPAYALAVHSMQCFDHAVSHWSRQRELLADAAGARISGPQAVVDSLVRIGALEALIEDYEAQVCAQLSTWPDDLLEAMLAHLAEQEVKLPGAELVDELAHPTDTHPPTLQRIQALGKSIEDVHAGEALRPVVASQALARLAEDLPDVPGLSRQLSAAIGNQLLAQRQEARQELQTRVEAVTDECIVHEGAQWRGRLLVLMAIVCLGAALWLGMGLQVQGAKPGLAVFLNTSALVVAGVGALIGVLGWRMIKRAHTAALVFTPHAIRFANSPEAIALHHVDDYTIGFASGLSVIFQLAEDAPLPVFNRRRFWEPDAKFDAKSRRVTLRLGRWSVNGKALNAGELVVLVGRYLEGGHARQVLRTFDEDTAGL